MNQLHLCAAAMAMLVSLAASAGCSRPMQVPIGPSGMSVRINGDDVGGLVPDLLRRGGKLVGCEWIWTIAPRARVEAMFEAGQSDLMLAVTRTTRREELGHFIPMLSTRASVIHFGANLPTLRTLADIAARKELRVAALRGADYGEEFNALLDLLASEKRLIFESNPVAVARVIEAGRADLTITIPIAQYGPLNADPRFAYLVGKMRFIVLDDLTWSQTGLYISKASVNAADRAVLEKMFADMLKSGVMWNALKANYPLELLRESVRMP
jgi:polar amino acid transport system substrate-binding protein